MFYPRNLTVTDLQDLVCKHYGLVMSNAMAMPSSSINQAWKITAASQTFLLKKCNNAYDSVWLDFANVAMRCLREQGAERLLAMTQDGRVFVESRDAFWTLSRYVDSAPFRFHDQRLLRSVGAYLRRLHDVDLSPITKGEEIGAGISGRNEIAQWYESSAEKLRRVLHLCREYPQLITPAEVNALSKTMDLAISEISCERYHRLPKALSHGEFQNQNILLTRDDEIHVIDWDSLNVRARIIDVVSSVLFMCRKGRGDFSLNHEAALEYLSAYQLSDVEIQELASIAFIYMLPSEYMVAQFRRHAPENINWYIPWAINGAVKAYVQVSNLVETLCPS